MKYLAVVGAAALGLCLAGCGGSDAGESASPADTVGQTLLSAAIQGQWQCTGTPLPTDEDPFLGEDGPVMKAQVDIRDNAWRVFHVADGSPSDGIDLPMDPEPDWEGTWEQSNGSVILKTKGQRNDAVVVDPDTGAVRVEQNPRDEGEQFADLKGIPESVEGDTSFSVSGVNGGSLDVTWSATGPALSFTLPSALEDYPFLYYGGDTQIECARSYG